MRARNFGFLFGASILALACNSSSARGNEPSRWEKAGDSALRISDAILKLKSVFGAFIKPLQTSAKVVGGGLSGEVIASENERVNEIRAKADDLKRLLSPFSKVDVGEWVSASGLNLLSLDQTDRALEELRSFRHDVRDIQSVCEATYAALMAVHIADHLDVKRLAKSMTSLKIADSEGRKEANREVAACRDKAKALGERLDAAINIVASARSEMQRGNFRGQVRAFVDRAVSGAPVVESDSIAASQPEPLADIGNSRVPDAHGSSADHTELLIRSREGAEHLKPPATEAPFGSRDNLYDRPRSDVIAGEQFAIVGLQHELASLDRVCAVSSVGVQPAPPFAKFGARQHASSGPRARGHIAVGAQGALTAAAEKLAGVRTASEWKDQLEPQNVAIGTIDIADASVADQLRDSVRTLKAEWMRRDELHSAYQKHSNATHQYYRTLKRIEESLARLRPQSDIVLAERHDLIELVLPPLATIAARLERIAEEESAEIAKIAREHGFRSKVIDIIDLRLSQKKRAAEARSRIAKLQHDLSDAQHLCTSQESELRRIDAAIATETNKRSVNNALASRPYDACPNKEPLDRCTHHNLTSAYRTAKDRSLANAKSADEAVTRLTAQRDACAIVLKGCREQAEFQTKTLADAVRANDESERSFRKQLERLTFEVQNERSGSGTTERNSGRVASRTADYRALTSIDRFLLQESGERLSRTSPTAGSRRRRDEPVRNFLDQSDSDSPFRKLRNH